MISPVFRDCEAALKVKTVPLLESEENTSYLFLLFSIIDSFNTWENMEKTCE
jgi:hypothetical protein